MTIIGASGRLYDPLPIDNTAGFPQQFPLLRNGVNYQFRLYVDVPEGTLAALPVSLSTSAMTAPGSATLQFAAVPASIMAGMSILDNTTGSAIPAGTTVQSTLATRVVMSQNASGAGVGAGDAIQFANEVMVLPDAQRFLVVRVDVLGADAGAQTIFLRKVVPSLEYRAGELGLVFPTQIVARRNLNGIGSFGSNVVGGVSSL
jgi:hypothetical protein